MFPRDRDRDRCIPRTDRGRDAVARLLGLCLLVGLTAIRPASGETVVDMPLPPASMAAPVVAPVGPVEADADLDVEAAADVGEEAVPTRTGPTPLERYRFARITPEFNGPAWSGRWTPRRRYSFGGFYARYSWRSGRGWGWGGGCGWGWPFLAWGGKNVVFFSHHRHGVRPASH